MLYCPGVRVNHTTFSIPYPIAQAPDNDYYLTHLFTGEKNKVGSIFLDYRNQRDFSDKNTIIYGHNMLDGSMFSSLTNYAEQSYYESYPQMTLFTPRGNYSLQLFAGIVLDGSEDTIRFTFTDNDDFSNYIRMLKENSTFTSSVSVMPEDPIVTLSTCSYTFNNARYVLFGRLASDVDS